MSEHRRPRETFLDTINEIAVKSVVPGVVDSLTKSSPLLTSFRRGFNHGRAFDIRWVASYYGYQLWSTPTPYASEWGKELR